jgi:hypothetical protein
MSPIEEMIVGRGSSIEAPVLRERPVTEQNKP